MCVRKWMVASVNCSIIAGELMSPFIHIILMNNSLITKQYIELWLDFSPEKYHTLKNEGNRKEIFSLLKSYVHNPIYNYNFMRIHLLCISNDFVLLEE